MVQRWLGFSLQLLIAMLAISVVALATQLRSNTAFTGASLVSLMSFGESISNIVQMYTMLETSIGAVNRLKTFSEKVKPEDLEGEDVVPSPEWPLQGGIQINGVSAAYKYVDGRSYLNDIIRECLLQNRDIDDEPAVESASTDNTSTSSSRNLAVRDLTLSIAPGERVAICGRSGRYVAVDMCI